MPQYQSPVLALRQTETSRTIVTDVLFDHTGPRRWAAEAMRLMAELPGFEIRHVFALDTPCHEPQSRWLRSEGLRRQPLLDPVGGPVKRVSLDGLRAGLAGDPADVLLYMGLERLDGRCDGLAREAVASVRFGSGSHRRFLWPEIAGNAETVPVSVLRHGDDWSSGEVVGRAESSKEQSLFYLAGATAALDTGGYLVVRMIQQLLGGDRLAEEADGTIPHPAPSLAGYAAARLAHSLRARTTRRGLQRQWFVAWRQRQGEAIFGADEGVAPDGFRVYEGRSNLGYADPFPYCSGGQPYLFIEEVLPNRKGRLVVAEVNQKGVVHGPPEVILECPYHLSYPFVFEHDGAHYLMPESAEGASLDLYRAEEFPHRWVKHRTLASGVRLLDTTPLFHEGLWYFFTTTQLDSGAAGEHLLFTATALDGPWVWHPANPISMDARRIRSAGRIRQWQGRLLRPVQDCSLDYGRAIRVLEITRLNPKEYSDREVSMITPGWHADAIRTHTLNWSDQIEAIDGCRWV